MPCFHPLLRQQQSIADPDSWKVFKIHDKMALNFYKNEIQEEISEGVSYSMLVPCGKCAGCRLDRAKEWTTRLIMEKSLFPDNTVWFLTLTYEHMPMTEGGLPTLVKKDVQDFFKRWRYYHGDFRYFLAGEYGDHTFRPHYHMIGFGMSFSDLQFYCYSDSKQPYYISDDLANIWSKGNCLVAPADAASIAYTSRYVLKKQGADTFKGTDVQPTFEVMSRRPGLGSGFFDQFLYDCDFINIPGGDLAKFPRYFDKIMEQVDPRKLKDHKSRRILRATLDEINRLSATSVTFADYLVEQEKLFISRQKSRDIL